MDTPKLPPGTLVLRFVLELLALVAWGWTGWTVGEASGWLRGVPTLGLPLAAVVVWGLFNVPGDPSRSGRAPVVVRGVVRLALEAVFFGGAWMGLALAGDPWWALAMGVLTVVHYATSTRRLSWMARR